MLSDDEDEEGDSDIFGESDEDDDRKVFLIMVC